MRCETCQGRGQVKDCLTPQAETAATPAKDILFVPCPDCGGSGIAHCCDGLCEQPDRLS
jgi:hypothetical protein